jgi:hypothetical protein
MIQISWSVGVMEYWFFQTITPIEKLLKRNPQMKVQKFYVN